MSCRSFAVAVVFATLSVMSVQGRPVRLAVFGGAESLGPSAEAAKAVWRQGMDCSWDDFGVEGAGFVAGREAGHEISAQLRRAFHSGKAYDMFVLWSSDADVRPDGGAEGDVEKGLLDAIDLVRTNAPHGQIVLFTPTQRPLEPERQKAIERLSETLFRVASAKNVSVLDFGRDIPFPKDGTDGFFAPDGSQLSADGYRFVADRQSKYLKYIHSVGWGVEPSLLQDRDELDRTLRRTKALHDAKWGVFNHYLGHRIKTADEWRAKVESFDVKKVADQLEACGARFYFLTLLQGRRWMCAPNATYDRIAGTRPGEACSVRDLPLELAQELEKRGIDLYLYYTGDGPYMDKEVGQAFGFTEPRFLGVTRPFVEKWASVLEEFAVRYGPHVKGWWIDGCYADFLRYTDDLLGMYERAIRKGNANAAVAMNNGVFDYYARYSARADFTAGEFNDFYCVPNGRIVQGAQAFALIPLGAWQSEGKDPGWGCRGCKRNADYVANYVGLVNDNGGTVAIDVHVDPDGTWDAEQMEVLKAVGRKTGTLREPAPKVVRLPGRWCSIGTSITWYNNHVESANGRFSRGYQDRVMDVLAFDSFVNGGVNGGDVALVLKQPIVPADWYTVELGINDWGYSVRPGTMEDYVTNASNETFAARYRMLVDRLRASNPKAKVILCTPRRGYGFGTHLPSCSSDAKNGLYLSDYVEIVRKVAAREGFGLADFYERCGKDEELADLSIDVALHPNDKGYQRMADELVCAFRRMSEPRPRRADRDISWMRGSVGVSVHWTSAIPAADGSVSSFEEAVNAFDVTRFADQIKSMGARHLIFTTAHGEQMLPMPNAALDAIVPGRTAKRDLFGEILDACTARGVRVIAYYNHSCNGTNEAVRAWESQCGFPNGVATGGCDSVFSDNIASIVSDMSLRYGKKIAGWWFDSAYSVDSRGKFVGVFGQWHDVGKQGAWKGREVRFDWPRLLESARRGNPDAAVAINAGVGQNFQYDGDTDYYAGEAESFDERFTPCGDGRRVETRWICADDPNWTYSRSRGFVPLRKSVAELRSYVREHVRAGRMVTFNVLIDRKGVLNPFADALADVFRSCEEDVNPL